MDELNFKGFIQLLRRFIPLIIVLAVLAAAVAGTVVGLLATTQYSFQCSLRFFDYDLKATSLPSQDVVYNQFRENDTLSGLFNGMLAQYFSENSDKLYNPTVSKQVINITRKTMGPMVAGNEFRAYCQETMNLSKLPEISAEYENSKDNTVVTVVGESQKDVSALAAGLQNAVDTYLQEQAELNIASTRSSLLKVQEQADQALEQALQALVDFNVEHGGSLSDLDLQGSDELLSLLEDYSNQYGVRSASKAMLQELSVAQELKPYAQYTRPIMLPATIEVLEDKPNWITASLVGAAGGALAGLVIMMIVPAVSKGKRS